MREHPQRYMVTVVTRVDGSALVRLIPLLSEAGSVGEAVADTVPEAICRAALAATGSGPGAGEDGG